MKKLFAFIGSITILTVFTINIVSCSSRLYHYTPEENPSLEPEITSFLAKLKIVQFSDDNEYRIQHGNDDTFFNTFSKKAEAHTIAPLINLSFNNNSRVENFELSNNNVLFKLYLAIDPMHLPVPSELWKVIELFSLIKETKQFTYTYGGLELPEESLEGGKSVTKVYYMSVNLNSNVFWNFEINKDLSEYLINYVQTNQCFSFPQDILETDIIKEWLTEIYSDGTKFNLANIVTIPNVSDLLLYLQDKIKYQFIALNTTTLGNNDKFEVQFSDLLENYKWNMANLPYLIK